jgi:DNA-binding NarL/FixJ family response regulator
LIAENRRSFITNQQEKGIMKTTIAIATHQKLLCESLGFIVENEDFEVTCLEQEGILAFQKIRLHQPQIAIIDLDLPQMDGIEILKALRKENSQTRFIFFVTKIDSRKVSQAFDFLPNGFLHINGSMTDVILCVNAVKEGKSFFSDIVYAICQASNVKKHLFSAKINMLTNREKEILEEVGKDLDSKEIADKLFISIKTVENHKTHISEKLNLKGHKALKQFVLNMYE